MAPFHPRLKSLGFPGCRLVNNDGRSALMYAIMNNNVDGVNTLISHGADIDNINKNKHHIFNTVGRYLDISIIKLLLKNGIVSSKYISKQGLDIIVMEVNMEKLAEENEQLRDNNKKLMNELEELKNHIKYKPDGPGYHDAKNEFEIFSASFK